MDNNNKMIRLRHRIKWKIYKSILKREKLNFTPKIKPLRWELKMTILKKRLGKRQFTT
jgi:hypothetical protein